MAYRGEEDDEQKVYQPLHEAITAQMISIVSARLNSLQTTANNRMHGLECDLRVDSDYCSNLVPPFVDMLESRGEATAPRRAISATTLASNKSMLERLFGSDETAQAQVIKKKRMDVHKNENRRNVRSLVEKQLQVSIESHFTRTVENFTYGLDDGEVGEGTTSTRCSIFMNTKLLLMHTSERIHVTFGRSSFKRFLLSELSGALFEDIFWLVFCHFYQKDSLAQQRAIADAISAKYIKMIAATPRDTMDFLLRVYPYAIASAICSGFYYLFPGSRHLYTLDFKNGVYLFVCRLLLGLEMTLASIQFMRRQYFPEEVVEDFGNKTRQIRKLVASASTGEILKGAVTRTRYGRIGEKSHLPRLLSPQTDEPLAGSASESSLVFKYTTGDSEDSNILEAQEGRVLNPFINEMDGLGTPHRVRRHQRRALFNTSQLSPLMMQSFHSPTKFAKKVNFVLRTTPSADCVVGGENTYHKFYQRKPQKGYAAEAQRQHEIFKREIQKEQRDFTQEIAVLHETRDLVLSSGKKRLQAYCTGLMSRKHVSDGETTAENVGITVGTSPKNKW